MILDILYKERHFIKEGDLTFEFFLIKEMSSFLYLCASICSFVKKKIQSFCLSVNGNRPNSYVVANFR